MKSFKWYPTGNSKTKIAFNTRWLVMDVGSGHNPHPRADVLVDRFLLDNTERSGQKLVLPHNKYFVVADACAMPFKDKIIDFAICSHIAEHIDDIEDFFLELNRIAKKGFLETPSKIAEILRHAPNHRWFISKQRNKIVFSPAAEKYPLGQFGKLFFSLYFYKNIQARERNVFSFAQGCGKPLHYFFAITRWCLFHLWLLLKPFTYTRLLWEAGFSWQIKRNSLSARDNTNE
jgi:hypothetical protein